MFRVDILSALIFSFWARGFIFREAFLSTDTTFDTEFCLWDFFLMLNFCKLWILKLALLIFCVIKAVY